MKNILLFCVCMLSVINLQAQDLKEFKKEKFKDKEGNELLYRILYPKTYDKKKSYPLLLFLHGMGKEAMTMRRS